MRNKAFKNLDVAYKPGTRVTIARTDIAMALLCPRPSTAEGTIVRILDRGASRQYPFIKIYKISCTGTFLPDERISSCEHQSILLLALRVTQDVFDNLFRAGHLDEILQIPPGKGGQKYLLSATGMQFALRWASDSTLSHYMYCNIRPPKEFLAAQKLLATNEEVAAQEDDKLVFFDT